MKRLMMISMLFILLAGCNSSTEVSGLSGNDSEEALKLLASKELESPEKGDIFLIQSDSEKQFIYAYIEKGSEVSVSEDETILNINFKEPNENGQMMLQIFELDMADEVDTLNFYINDKEAPVTEVVNE